MAGTLRKLFKNQDILDAFEIAEGSSQVAADILTLQCGRAISYQTANYWKRNLTEVVKKNGQPYIGTTVLDRKIREGMELRRPDAKDYESDVEVTGNNRIMLWSCDHAPYNHPDEIFFLSAVNDWLQPDRFLHLGDEADNHALSFHDSDPNLDAAGPELLKAQVHLKRLASLFPNLEVLNSNHGSLVYRKAKKMGIPVEAIKSYRDILFPDGGGDGWSWKHQVRLTLPDGSTLQVQHQANKDLLGIAAHDRCNLLVGHNHTIFDLQHVRSKACSYWAGHVGCLADPKSPAFAYTDGQKNLQMHGCCVVIDSEPHLIPMELDKHWRWTGRLGGVAKWMTVVK